MPGSASSDQSKSFHDLIDLLAHVADCYPDLTKDFPDDLTSVLMHHQLLEAELREKIVGSLALLRRKELIESADLLKTFFNVLVSTPSATLRRLLFQKICSDLRASNSKTTNHRLNRTIQTVLYNLVASDRTSPKAIWAVKLIRELWKRQVWTTAPPVDIMAEACQSDCEKVVVGAVRFFLASDQDREELEDDSSDEEAVDLKKVQHSLKMNKKTNKAKEQYKKAVAKVKRVEKKKGAQVQLNFSALHLLKSPQDFVEKLWSKHLHNTKSKLALESKLLVLSLVTRLVGLHQLIITPMYGWFSRYLTPRQESVTSFLAALAQATHRMVPPDYLEPLVKKIANEFVSEGSSAEVASAGLNAIREICSRQDLAMTEELLQDLIQFRKSKDKGVVMAARGLLSLYRDAAPELLARRDRGKTASMGLRSGEISQRKFGQVEEGGIEGLELLEQYHEEKKAKAREERGGRDDEPGMKDDESDDEGFNSSAWEVDSDDESTDSGGWINVSDSEEDEPSAKRQKTKTQSAEPDDTENTVPEIKPLSMSKLATTTILTPADLAKLRELRTEAKVDKALGNNPNKRRRAQELAAQRHLDDGLTAEQIELPAKLRKTTKEERVALAREGKPDREEHKSTQAIRKAKKEAEGKSTTNKEKARKKNMLMTMGKARMKQKRSLVQTRKALQAHVERSKRGGRRRNGG